MRATADRPWIKTTVCAVLLVVLTGCASAVKTVVFQHPKAKKIFTPPKPDRHITGAGWTNSIGDGTNVITVLHLTGENYYSLGYHHGELLGPEVKATIESVERGAQKFIPKEALKLLSEKGKRQFVNAILDRAWSMMERFVPEEDLEEMAGLADGLKAAGITGVDLATLHRVHAIPDLGETSCSALVAKGSATRDGHVYQLRVLDYGGGFGLERHPLITVYHSTRTNENTFIDIGWIGFVGLVSGMNEKGVAISEMGFGNPPGETLAGEPMIFLLKRVLRNADTAEGAASIIRAAKRNNSYAYWLGDRGGGAIGMVTSAQQCQMFRVNECEQVSHGTAKLRQFADVIYAGHYGEKQGKLVEQMRGTFDLAAIKDMAKKIRMNSNLHTVIFDLTTGDLCVANRHGSVPAAECPYVDFHYSDWKSEPLATHSRMVTSSAAAPAQSP